MGDSPKRGTSQVRESFSQRVRESDGGSSAVILSGEIVKRCLWKHALVVLIK